MYYTLFNHADKLPISFWSFHTNWNRNPASHSNCKRQNNKMSTLSDWSNLSYYIKKKKVQTLQANACIYDEYKNESKLSIRMSAESCSLTFNVAPTPQIKFLSVRSPWQVMVLWLEYHNHSKSTIAAYGCLLPLPHSHCVWCPMIDPSPPHHPPPANGCIVREQWRGTFFKCHSHYCC